MSYNHEARKSLFEEAAIRIGHSVEKDELGIYINNSVSDAWAIFSLIELDDI